eukprot:TRINITY_DN8471_c0_g1_i1.p1 TRINITY_DN8471_c0_g1~~TRINITY_DN8471_c0_g1_i1.p1  ORF type:complete len:299 (+),score=37.21 TRINITY_DN8471_c0_g1_i1:35-898(+)
MAVKVSVQGQRSRPGFHRARVAAQALEDQKKRDFVILIEEMSEMDWSLRMENLQHSYPGQCDFAESVAIFVGNQLLESVGDFEAWLEDKIEWKRPSAETLQDLASRAENSYRRDSGHSFVFMDVTIGGSSVGRLIFELLDDQLPKTCANFRHLCIGDKPSLLRDDSLLTYQGSKFHRIQPKGWVQGGDILGSSGNQGESIYGETFEDEGLHIQHAKRGVLGMANNGLHSNNSQFFITFRQMGWMDTKYVAFGYLYEGSQVLDALEDQEAYNQRPKKECVITACGLLQ